ncbi:unnamed protein product [Didymodactylos carnosus]|uniref:Uncharacterized protein n=1 Tax=Didymodactylos carnosus TaxID=1234261 RepID=A0A8S2KML7_9BILA|nr:unnamed protein product [Didymodactylos carnosus]CAF3860987.1 unnamed protein product [Didymodactylos carnosus]
MTPFKRQSSFRPTEKKVVQPSSYYDTIELDNKTPESSTSEIPSPVIVNDEPERTMLKCAKCSTTKKDEYEEKEINNRPSSTSDFGDFDSTSTDEDISRPSIAHFTYNHRDAGSRILLQHDLGMSTDNSASSISLLTNCLEGEESDGKEYMINTISIMKCALSFLGTHESRFLPLGCKFNLYPDKPVLRRTLRGLVVGAAAVAAPVAAVGAVALLAVGTTIGAPTYGTYRLVKHIRHRRQQRQNAQQSAHLRWPTLGVGVSDDDSVIQLPEAREERDFRQAIEASRQTFAEEQQRKVGYPPFVVI